MRILFLAAALAVCPIWADAKPLYVNGQTGNDATTYADNSEARPWRTIGRAAWGSTSRSAPNASEAARAGDVVNVAAGAYSTVGTGNRYEVAYNPVNSGTGSNPLVFEASGTVTLTYSSGAGPMIGACGGAVCGGGNRDYIVWRGFTINEVNALSVPDTGPVVFVNTVGSIIENSVITGVGNNGREDNYTGVRIDTGRGVIVRNNRISNFLGYGRNSAGIMTYYSGQLLFENNEITNTGSGIYLKANFNNTDWITIRYNLIYGVQTGGIDIHRQPNTAAAPVKIYQNVIRNSASGIKIHGFDSGSTDARNVRIVNNTLVNNSANMHILYAMVANAGHAFWNNIVYGGDWGIIMEGPSGNVTPERIDFEHNIYSGSRSLAELSTVTYSLSSWRGTGQDSAAPAGLNQNPNFSNLAAFDFRLQSSSPARTLGVDVLDLDNDGNTTEIIPAGAYITGSEVIGPTSGTGLPAAPSGLRIAPQGQ